MNTNAAAKIEAIANADAHTSNVGLPSYSDLLEMLKAARKFAQPVADDFAHADNSDAAAWMGGNGNEWLAGYLESAA